MGLDLGLEATGIIPILACESDKMCRGTITENRPDIALIGDISKYDACDIRDFAGLRSGDDIDLIVGGPPCQSFSTAGARKSFNDRHGNVFLRYIDLILDLRPRYAVIENVRGLLSAPILHRPHADRNKMWSPTPDELPGSALMYILTKLRAGGYGVSFNLYNTANFGVPEIRERVVILCSRDGSKVPHLVPTHSESGEYGLPRWRTLREAISGLRECNHVEFPEERLRYYRLLGPGQYWKHLPRELHKSALGNAYFSGGGKTGFLRRLDWDKPSCTLLTSPNMPATDLCHPTENRPLSIEEYKRIQQFPADWTICGTLSDQYRQVGNAVPVGLGEAIGRAILAHKNGEVALPPEGFPHSRYKGTDEVSWEIATEKMLRGEGNPKRSYGAARGTSLQLSLL